MSALEQFEQTYVRPRAGRTLIVGSQVYGGKEDRRARYANAVGIDMLPGEGVDRVLDLEEQLPADIGQFDHIECMSVLEHSRRPWLLAANLERLMAYGGTLFVSVPWLWREHSYPGDYQRFSGAGLRQLFRNIEWSAMMQASDELLPEKAKIRAVKIDGHVFMARTETCGFGVLA